MASGKVFTYRLEYQTRTNTAWTTLYDPEGDVVTIQEGSKSDVDLIFWALMPNATAARFVQHGARNI